MTTLAQLRTKVARKADVELETNGRHDPEDVDGYINEALGRYFQLLTNPDPGQRIKRTVLTTTGNPADSNGWPGNEVVELPEDFDSLVKVSLLEGKERRILSEFSEWDQDWYSRPDGEPEAFKLGYNSNSRSILRLHPQSDATYSLEVLYVFRPVALVEDSDSFEFLPGTEDYVVCDVALQILENDGVPEGSQFNALASRKAQAEHVLRRAAADRNRAGGTQMKDTWSRRRRGRRNRHTEWLD